MCMKCVMMPQIAAMISEDLNKRFRDEVSERYGAYKRGSIQKALISAIETWLRIDQITMDEEKKLK